MIKNILKWYIDLRDEDKFYGTHSYVYAIGILMLIVILLLSILGG